jgi:hypothetical protein
MSARRVGLVSVSRGTFGISVVLFKKLVISRVDGMYTGTFHLFILGYENTRSHKNKNSIIIMIVFNIHVYYCEEEGKADGTGYY